MTKERKQEIISTYRRDEKDTGSSEVHDNHSRRGLLKWLVKEEIY